MLYRALLFVSAFCAGVAFVFQSVPATAAAAVIGLFAFSQKGIE